MIDDAQEAKRSRFHRLSAPLRAGRAGLILLVAAAAAGALNGTGRAQDGSASQFDPSALRSAASARADRRLGLLPDLRGRLSAGEGYRGDLGAYLEADDGGERAGVKLSARSLAYWAEKRFLAKIEAARALRRKRLGDAAQDAPPPLRPGAPTGGDVWMLGRGWRSEGETSVTADGALAVGAERAVGDGVSLGVMSQLDRRLYEAETARVRREGWLAGPYLLARPKPSLTIEALAGVGQAVRRSDGADPVLSEGYLVRGRVEGALDLGAAVTAKPQASVMFQHEIGAPLDDPEAGEEGLSRGELSFGPRLERAFAFEDLAWAGDVTATPFAKMGGSWGFGPDSAADPFSARSEAGFEARLENGWSVSGSSYLDGIGGAAEESYGGKLDFKLALP